MKIVSSDTIDVLKHCKWMKCRFTNTISILVHKNDILQYSKIDSKRQQHFPAHASIYYLLACTLLTYANQPLFSILVANLSTFSAPCSFPPKCFLICCLFHDDERSFHQSKIFAHDTILMPPTLPKPNPHPLNVCFPFI